MSAATVLRPCPLGHTAGVIHATTILAVRHQDRTVPGRRRPGDVRQHRAQAGRAQDPAALQRVDPGRVCRLGRRLLRALLAVRIQARTVSRQPRARGGGAGARLAHRSPAAPARGDADRRRPEVDLSALRHRRSDRARRRHRGGGIGRAVCDGRGARARAPQPARRARRSPRRRWRSPPTSASTPTPT